MPIDSDLQAAGRRAPTQHVPAAPSIAVIEAGAAKHTSRRRMIVSSAAALVLVALAFPLALTIRGSTTVQTVAVGTGQAGAAQLEPVPAAAQEDQGTDDTDQDADPGDGIRIQLRSGDDLSLSIRVLSGEQAVRAGEVATAGANETLDVDGLAVWVSGTGDERTVSALVEPEEFIEVTGNATELDMLIDVLRDGGWVDRGGRHGFSGLDDPEWQAFFDRFESGDFNFNFDVDGNGFDDIEELLRDFDVEVEGLDELFGPDGELFFEGLDQFFGPDGEFNFDSDGFSFDGDFDFDDFFGPDGEFNFDSDGFVFGGDFSQFFGSDGEFNFDSDAFGAEFDGCIVIDGSDHDNGDAFNLEFPEGCSSTG